MEGEYHRGLFITINSSDRTAPDYSNSADSTDFDIRMPQNYRCHGLELERVVIPLQYQTIHSDKANQTLNYNDGGAASISIANGSYNGSTLAAAIQAALIASGSALAATFTCTFDAAQNRFTIANSGGNFSILAGGLNAVIGFQNATYAAAASHTSDRPISLLPNTIFIRIENADVSSQITSEKYFTFEIPVSVDAGNVQIYEPFRKQVVDFHAPRTLNRTQRIRLFEANGAPVRIANYDWSMTLKML